MPTLTIRVNFNQDISHLSPVFRDTNNFFRGTRSTWLPNELLNNRQLHHGDTFTVTGFEAVYFRNLINNGILQNFEIVVTPTTGSSSATGDGGLTLGGAAVAANMSGFSITGDDGITIFGAVTGGIQTANFLYAATGGFGGIGGGV